LLAGTVGNFDGDRNGFARQKFILIRRDLHCHLRGRTKNRQNRQRENDVESFHTIADKLNLCAWVATVNVIKAEKLARAV
jgi:hypothetical protein